MQMTSPPVRTDAPRPVERAWMLLAHALETHGWALLAALAALWLLRERLRAWAAARARRESLRQANDPARVALLRRDAARVREKQQRALLETARNARNKPKAT